MFAMIPEKDLGKLRYQTPDIPNRQ